MGICACNVNSSDGIAQAHLLPAIKLFCTLFIKPIFREKINANINIAFFDAARNCSVNVPLKTKKLRFDDTELQV